MRIALDGRFITIKPMRGIGVYSLNLVKELIKNNPSDEFIIYLSEPDIDHLIPDSNNVKIRVLKPSIYPFWEQFALPLAIFYDKPDIYHALGNTAPLWIRSCTRLVLTLHDVMFLQSHEFVPKPVTGYQRAGRLYRKFIVPINANLSDAVITISEFSRKDILNLISNLSSEKVFTILEACDPKFAITDSAILPENFIGESFLLCLGAEDPRKNTEKIVEGYLNAVQKHGIEEDLVIVGYANWSQSSSYRLVKNASLNNRVHFLPFITQSELIAIYRHATGLLYVSLYEGFGIPILEAFSSGCPLIASNITSIPEIGGDAALYVDPTDIHDIETAIVKICKDVVLRENLKMLGFIRASQFSWEKTAKQTLNVYHTVMDCHKVEKS